MNKRQIALLTRLGGEETGTGVGAGLLVSKKAVNMTDLAAMTAVTGDEFALFTRGAERLIVRGNTYSLPTVSVEFAEQMAAQGWRWSGHVHPGFGPIMASAGDEAVLIAFGQNRSVILNGAGRHFLFTVE